MIVVKIQNARQIENAVKRYPELSSKYFKEAIERSLIGIKREAMLKAPVDTGALRARWNMAVRFLRGVLSPVKKYAGAVEYGAKPHFVSVKKLKGWARRHGISPYAVQRSIAKKGTKAQPFLGPAVDEKKINQEFSSALDKVLKKI